MPMYSSLVFPQADAALWFPEEFLLLLVVPMFFALAADLHSVVEKEEQDEAVGTAPSPVQLVRPEAIAVRFGIATATIAVLKVLTKVCKILPRSPREGFSPSVATLEASEEVQLILVSFLLLVFSTLIKPGEDDAKQVGSESNEKVKGELVRPHAIAFRLSLATSALALLKALHSGFLNNICAVGVQLAQALPASPREGFPPASAALQVPHEIQLLLLVPLMLVFAAAVHTSDECEQQSGAEKNIEKRVVSPVKLVRPDAIAFRFAVVIGVIALLKACAAISKMLPPLERGGGFASQDISLEVPEAMQLLVVSSLLLVFSGLIKSADDEARQQSASVSAGSEKTCKVNLVRPHAIAFRLAVAAGGLALLKAGSHGVFGQLSSLLPASPPEGFPSGGSSLDVPDGIQLLSVSALLFIFALAVRDMDLCIKPGESEDKPNAPVQLVRSDVIALRLSLAAGIIGSLNLFGLVTFATPPPMGTVQLRTLPSFISFMWGRLAEKVPTSPREGFAPASAEVEAPEGILLLIASALLLVFAMAIDSADCGPKQRISKAISKSPVQLVRPRVIATRLSTAAGCYGVVKAVGPLIGVALTGDMAMKCGLLTIGTGLVLSNSRQNPLLHDAEKTH